MTGPQVTVMARDGSGSLPWLLGQVRARTVACPSFGGFAFIGVITDLSIVAEWPIDSRSPMSALGTKRKFTIILAECLLLGVKRPQNQAGIKILKGRSRHRAVIQEAIKHLFLTWPQQCLQGLANRSLATSVLILENSCCRLSLSLASSFERLRTPVSWINRLRSRSRLLHQEIRGDIDGGPVPLIGTN